MIDIFEKELEALLTAKPYNELLDGERTYVLQHLTEEEYNKYHLLLSCSIVSFAGGVIIKPDYVVKQNLKSAFRAKYKKPSFNLGVSKFILSKLFYKPKLSITFVLIFIGYFLWLHFHFKEQIKPIATVKLETRPKQVVGLSISKKQTSKKNAFKGSLRTYKNLRIVTLKHKRVVKPFNHLLLIPENQIDEPLCLKIKIVPAAINLEIKEYLVPCLTTNISHQDSLINEVR